MGTMNFQLPRQLPAQAADAWRFACIAGGYDHTPSPTTVRVKDDRMTLTRPTDESGYLVTPWPVNGAGLLMTSSATLMERAAPYSLNLELARGKLNQVRGQLADWKHVGLSTTPEFDAQYKDALREFGRAVIAGPGDDADRIALDSLGRSYALAESLIGLYVDQLLTVRRARQPKLDTHLSCRLRAAPPAAVEPALCRAVNAVTVPFSWRQVEPNEYAFNWAAAEAALVWAEKRQLPVTAGPLIDLSEGGLPDWLLANWKGDAVSVSSFISDYVETVVQKYKDRIRRWHVIAGGNCSEVLGLAEDDQVRLVARVVEAALNVDPELEIIVGVSQPWGDYMCSEEHTYSPFVFADTLLRAGMHIAALELEWLMGCPGRGSFCRDVLDASRLLDLFGLLGVPLQVALSYPSSKGIDPQADPGHQMATAGSWRAGFTPEVQAEWANRFAALAIAKPSVHTVVWDHFADAEPHLTPHGGLIDGAGRPKPALEALRRAKELIG